MDFFDAIQIQALKSVLQPDDGYLMRRVFRWYSEKYHTPLHLVEDLPIDELLTTYFEVMFENMDKSKLGRIKKRLLMTDEEREKKEKAKKNRKPRSRKPKKVVSDDDFMKMVREKAVGEAEVLAARQKAKEKDALQMMESMDDHDPLAPPTLPEFDIKF